MKCIIAGYTAAPADRAAARVYYDRIVQVPAARGLEFAWNGPQSPAQLHEALEFLPPTWQITLNDIPATFRTGVAQPSFGLASPDDAGRAAALRMLDDMRQTIVGLNDKAGRKVVLAAEIHCAPGFDQRTFTADADAFRRSLDSAATMPWDGCSVMVEHCDAYVPGQKPAKGFLPLETEIDVLAAMPGSPIKLSVNFGRSLVETHTPEGAMQHVRAGHASGLMRGFTFSGTAGERNVFGEAWADSHLPFNATRDPRYAEPASLMAPAHVREVMPYLDRCEFVAVKTNWPAARSDPEERAASVIDNFYTMLDAMNPQSARSPAHA
ncbi:MAG: DUF4862 family protein [Proteobacteria bacterium]|nr:DUF4862 family protein [Pseudomonadota bacterium]